MKQTLLISFFLLSLVMNAQTICTNGMAGEYPCNDYDLMSRVPVSTLANTSGTPEGSDIWGWTDPTTNKEYAIAAMTNSTAFVDVTDPLNPVYLGRLNSNSSNSFWRDVKVYNNHAFIVADNVGSHGMQVFDLTRLRGVTTPQNFTADTVYTGVNSCHNIVINEQSAVAYLVGCNTFGGGPTFVDISNPTNPTSLGGYSTAGYSHDAQVITYNGPDTAYTGKEIYIGSNEDKISILDVTDKNNVVHIKDFFYSQTEYTHQGWFTDDHRYFILGDELDEVRNGGNTRTLIFDLQDLDNPVLSSTYFGPTTAIDHNGYVKGNLFFMANYRAGLRVLDISNIGAATNAMTEVGFFDTHPSSNGTGFNGAWSVYPYFASGNIIINDIERGLFVIRKTGTLSTNNVNPKDLRLQLSPNPAKSFVSIKTENSLSIQTIEVFNILGKKVVSKQNINQSEYVLPVDQLARGVYIFKINNLVTRKLILR